MHSGLETRCVPWFPGGRGEPGLYGQPLTLSNAFLQKNDTFPNEVEKGPYANLQYNKFLAEIQRLQTNLRGQFLCLQRLFAAVESGLDTGAKPFGGVGASSRSRI